MYKTKNNYRILSPVPTPIQVGRREAEFYHHDVHTLYLQKAKHNKLTSTLNMQSTVAEEHITRPNPIHQFLYFILSYLFSEQEPQNRTYRIQMA